MTVRREIIIRSRQVRRKRRSIYAAFGLTLAVFAGIGFIVLLNQPRWLISKVQISGAEIVRAAEVENLIWETLSGRYGHLINRRSIFFYPRQLLVKKLLTAWPHLRDVRVAVVAGQTLRVELTERAAKFLWCSQPNDRCYFLDNDGVAFSGAPHFSDQALVVFSHLATSTTTPNQPLVLGERPIVQDVFLRLTKIVVWLPDALIGSPFDGFLVSRVTLLDSKDAAIVVSSRNNPEQPLSFLINLDFSVDNFQKYLKAILSSSEFLEALRNESRPLQSLDLRFSQKAFYRFWPL